MSTEPSTVPSTERTRYTESIAPQDIKVKIIPIPGPMCFYNLTNNLEYLYLLVKWHF